MRKSGWRGRGGGGWLRSLRMSWLIESLHWPPLFLSCKCSSAALSFFSKSRQRTWRAAFRLKIDCRCSRSPGSVSMASLAEDGWKPVSIVFKWCCSFRVSVRWVRHKVSFSSIWSIGNFPRSLIMATVSSCCRWMYWAPACLSKTVE